jgi:PIN domain nuclease of toxin-antitoxin system
MRLLLDTHVAIWALASPDLLTTRIAGLIADPANDVFVSAASVWEIAIKHALGRATGAPPFGGSQAVEFFRDAGYLTLPVSAEHAALVETLPPHHADPFDRLLVAQALHEPMRLVTGDPVVARYSETIIKI